MFDTIIAKVFNRTGSEAKSITTNEVILEALCAQRDRLIMSDEYGSSENTAKLALTHFAIDDLIAIM